MCGICAEPLTQEAIEHHLAATVDFFLRAYAPQNGQVP
jgi:hypothetical protein